MAPFPKYLVALTIVGIVDAISYMLVTPSLIFYVLQNGGNQSQYGAIMSAFSFSSFCTKPFIGWWSDAQGFRAPYLATVVIALLGGVGYVAASALPSGRLAVGAILGARLLSGCGAANSALGYAYVARSVPQSEQTSTTSLLSLCRILGMAIGPGFNVLVARIDIPVTNDWKLDSLNSVGIILVVANLISAAAIYCLLDEPKNDDEGTNNDQENDDSTKPNTTTRASLSSIRSLSISPSSSATKAFASFLSMDILIPMLSIFTFNANFQLIETGFSPAASDALGWGPIQSSAALGSLSLLIAVNMLSVIRLSKRGISDSDLLCGGLLVSIVAYTALYGLWIKDSSVWNFYLPILLAASSFPYMMATTRSIFTKSINAKPALKEYHGFMQAILSMAASVAGFTTPGIVAAYLLRSPEEVLASSDKRELTPYSLFAPALSLVVLLGMVLLRTTGALDKSAAAAAAGTMDAAADEGGGSSDEETVAPESSLNNYNNESSSLLPPPRRSSVQASKQKRRSSNMAIMLEGAFDPGLLPE